MSKMRSSLSRIFGRKKKSSELAARLESTLSAGKVDPDALSALRRLAADGGPEQEADGTTELSRRAIRKEPLERKPESSTLPREKAIQAPSASEVADLVASLPELDVNDLASSSRKIADMLRRQNRTS